MEKQNKGFVSSIGMFDLFKGVGVFIVVLGHTVNNFINFEEVNSVLAILIGGIYILFGTGVMPAFFMISGYGFRKMSVTRCIRQQLRLLLKPYVYTAVATVVLHLCIRYGTTHSIRTALWQTWQVFGGFLFALPANKEIFGVQFYFCGVMWYIIAMLWGWIILNTLMNLVKEHYMPVIVWVCACIGWLIGKERVIPFCIAQGLVAVLYLYYGYMLKKKKAFEKSFTKVQIVVSVLVCVISLVLAAIAGKMNNMADGVWTLGIVSILLDGYIGYLIIYMFLKMGTVKNIIFDFFKKIGTTSLFIIIVHTVEIHSIPWWMWIEHMKDSPVMGSIIQLIMRWIIIIIGVKILSKVYFRKNKYLDKVF